MLAKELKIKTILKQRQFIENMILMKSKNNDGDPACPYVGHLYVENIQYFKDMGFDVKYVESDALKADFKGLPAYIFTPSDEIVLSDEEMKEAEKYKGPSMDQVIYAMDEDAADKFMQALFGGMAENEDDGDDDEALSPEDYE